jgi:PIN domain nuclease of toxin-antitoxin system
MKYLLDTHTYLWFRSSPKVLPAAILEMLTDTKLQLFISVVVPWEIAIKVGAGKLSAGAILVDMESRESAAGFAFAPITPAQAIRSGLLPLHHRDPFDRLLAAQALDLRIPLISRDRVFDLYGVNRIWDRS